MTHNYRCTRRSCRKRVTKRRPIESYLRAHHRVCPACGGNLKPDPEPKRRAKALRCSCTGYFFPHRRGSLWCDHYQGERTEQDHRDRAYQLMRSYT